MWSSFSCPLSNSLLFNFRNLVVIESESVPEEATPSVVVAAAPPSLGDDGAEAASLPAATSAFLNAERLFSSLSCTHFGDDVRGSCVSSSVENPEERREKEEGTVCEIPLPVPQASEDTQGKKLILCFLIKYVL